MTEITIFLTKYQNFWGQELHLNVIIYQFEYIHLIFQKSAQFTNQKRYEDKLFETHIAIDCVYVHSYINQSNGMQKYTNVKC